MNKLIKAKTTSVTIVAVLMISAFVGAQLVATVKAAGYTEYLGTVDGVNFVLRIPDPWSGILVVMMTPGPSAPILDARTTAYNMTSTGFLINGYAIAASNYGGGVGYCFSKAVNSTYTMTKYIVENYHITGKVLLAGFSMGGNFALFLGEKYPDLYDGVLDVGGSKDAKSHYAFYDTIANLTILEIRSYLNLPSNTTDAAVQSIKNEAPRSLIAYQNETGGTPQQVPTAYEDRSNPYHANITIPVITIHSSSDTSVPVSQTTMYQAVVASLGRSSLYRVYITPPGVSANAQVPIRFVELVTWANQIGEYRGWKVVPSDGRIYIIPPQNLTGILCCQQIGTWDAEYYGKLGWTMVDAAKPAIDSAMNSLIR